MTENEEKWPYQPDRDDIAQDDLYNPEKWPMASGPIEATGNLPPNELKKTLPIWAKIMMPIIRKLKSDIDPKKSLMAESAIDQCFFPATATPYAISLLQKASKGLEKSML